MQTICVGGNIKIIFDGQRIAFARVDNKPVQESDLAEAEIIVELLNMRVGGNC